MKWTAMIFLGAFTISTAYAVEINVNHNTPNNTEKSSPAKQKPKSSNQMWQENQDKLNKKIDKTNKKLQEQNKKLQNKSIPTQDWKVQEH